MTHEGEESGGRTVLEARETVALLDAEAVELRGELQRLRADLRAFQRDAESASSEHQAEANGRLVVAALRAEALAAHASLGLRDLARANQRDAHTDTPNRALTLDRVVSALHLARRHSAGLAVMYLDIDGFKRINDSFGHAAGDAALQRVSRRIEDVICEADTVGRHGSDEFVVLLTELASASDPVAVAEKLLASLREPCVVGDRTIQLTASVGVAVFPEDGHDASSLIAAADAAMYVAKRQGGNCCARPDGVFRPAAASMRPTLVTVVSPELPGLHPGDLREANQRLVLSALATEQVGAEALANHRRQLQFLAMVAQGLANPLDPVRSAVELLQRVRQDEVRHAALRGVIEREVGHMTRVVDDLLAAAERGGHTPPPERPLLDIVAVLEVAAETCRAGLLRRRQTLVLRLPVGPLSVRGDRIHLGQVFSSLLDNASKFTPDGGRVGLMARVIEQTIRVTVSDDGVGIDAGALHRTFDLPSPETRARGFHTDGFGVGLSFVRDLVAAHHGTLVATSAGKRRGSQFVVTLPISAPHGPVLGG